MSVISTASYPTFSFQVDPLLNISPLIDLYPECLTHIVDADGLFQLSAHKSPIILSQKKAILNSSLSYQKSFARVKSPRCLLTIASFFLSWNYDTDALLEYIIPIGFRLSRSETIPTSNFAVLYPQSVIVLTIRDARSVDFYQPKNYLTCYSHNPLFFVLQLKEDAKSFPRISGALVYDPFESLSFNCSTFESCKNEMEQMITIVATIFRASWRSPGYKSTSDGGHPFERGVQAGIIKAVASFILAPTVQRNLRKFLCYPSFSKSYLSIPSETTESFPVSRTPGVKFVTTAGVYIPQSSYRVFVAPFLPAVWLGILISAGTSWVVMVGSYRIQSQRVETGLLRLIVMITTWTLATAIGQYHHSGIPMVSGNLSRKIIWIVTPVVLAWFILSTFLVNVYSAVFSSDATRSFYYLTNYTDYFQLPLDTLTCVLFNECYLRQNQWAIATEDNCTNEDRSENICFEDIVPAACDVPGWIRHALKQLSAETKLNGKTAQPQRLLIDERFKLWRTGVRVSLECANTETLSRLLRSKKPLVFLMPDHDFQRYWQLFVQLMQSDPTIKVANNFYSDGSDLSKPVAYEFTSGQHPNLKGSVVTRMKILLSSGIYDLWQKWDRIKFTDGGLLHAEKKLPPVNRVDPLSFDNSGTLWVFQAQVFAWLAATLIFLGERIAQCIPLTRFGLIVD